MPRRAREVSKTGVYHVMMRGINRQCIFEEKQDYQHFLRILREAKELFFEVTGCASVSGFRELPADKQREDIRRLINNNLSLRQVSNITGKSKSTVHRIVNEIKLI